VGKGDGIVLLNYLARIFGHISDDLKEARRFSNRDIRVAKSAEVLVTANLSSGNCGTIEIGENCFINDFCSITADGSDVKIGNGVLVGPGTIMHTVHHCFERIDVPIWKQGPIAKPIVVEDDVCIGANCTILGGVRIGAHSVIGANSLVNRDIPPFSIAFGVPCKVQKHRELDH
jgi:acetyltransferase-like isoleucine patch superfamily enzyme